MTLVLDSRRQIDLEAFRRVAWAGEPAEIAKEALGRIGERRASLLELVESMPGARIYGTTTGPDESVKQVLSAEEQRDYESHLTWPPGTFGDPLPERVVRGIVLARLANFIEGHAGVRPEIAQAVVDALDGRPLPSVPSRGNTWEVPAHAHLFGELARMGLELKEPMAFVNGAPAAAALVADVTLAGRSRLQLAELGLALAAEAILAPLEHFAPDLEELWGDEHETAALRTMRHLLEDGAEERRPYQAPVSFRILPRILGRVGRAQALAEEVAERSLQAVTDNPVYMGPDEQRPLGAVFSNGGFYNSAGIEAIDGLSFAWAELCQLVYLQSQRLVEDEPAFDGGRVPVRVLASAQAAWADDARAAAQPTFLPVVGTSQTDGGTLAFSAWRKSGNVGRCLEAMLANLAVIASDSLALAARRPPPALEPFLELVRAKRSPEGSWDSLGRDVGELAEVFAGAVYSPEGCNLFRPGYG